MSNQILKFWINTNQTSNSNFNQIKYHTKYSDVFEMIPQKTKLRPDSDLNNCYSNVELLENPR